MKDLIKPENAAEANVIKMILEENGIISEIRSFHDTAYNSLQKLLLKLHLKFQSALAQSPYEQYYFLLGKVFFELRNIKSKYF